jgi:hypothetical protein
MYLLTTEISKDGEVEEEVGVTREEEEAGDTSKEGTSNMVKGTKVTNNNNRGAMEEAAVTKAPTTEEILATTIEVDIIEG